MNLVADAGPRLRPPNPVLARGRGEVLVILRVLLADLQHIVVAVDARHFASHPVQLHRLEVLHGGGAGDVLDQDLVDLDADLFTGRHAAVGQVRLEDLAGQVLAHRSPLRRVLVCPSIIETILAVRAQGESFQAYGMVAVRCRGPTRGAGGRRRQDSLAAAIAARMFASGVSMGMTQPVVTMWPRP